MTFHRAGRRPPPSLVAAAAMLCGLAGVVGCGTSRPARLVPPSLDPVGAARAAMKLADADADGMLTDDELARVPGLRAIRGPLDADADGRLSAAEIEAWLRRIKKSRIAIGPCNFQVTQRGKPLANVAARMVPEPFMGRGMQAAEGESDAEGFVNPTIPGSRYHGVNCGLYRVELTGKGADGKPLPAKYNTETTLGIAVGGGLPADITPTLSLD